MTLMLAPPRKRGGDRRRQMWPDSEAPCEMRGLKFGKEEGSVETVRPAKVDNLARPAR